ncbi:CpaE family protein [Hyphobacterium sp. HN65]|uniref:CpaE family protein n=1 Tax=Hyphobacterium lacteum TaxID=3116575 RepID=A0ABU7LNM5_9PROT|nr:CpaE family protein [Hyphobacterium sp. HN65]MEE2525510.1 CpaE family protein [Hyphobacterium sp. HN65]
MAEPQAYDDEFLDEDDLLDPAEVERRLLDDSGEGFEEFGEDDGFGEFTSTEEDEPRPFGSRGATAPAQDEPESAEEPDHIADDFSDIDLDSFSVDLVDPMAGEIDDDIPDQPIPRITIHAFCERPESGALIHNAANDRRLAKAHVDVELGGLSAAVERFITQSTPDLLIIETGMRGQGLFDQLEELAGVCDPDTKVIIIGAANDISLYRELMKRGVSEYLVPPMSPLHLIRTISGLYLDPEAPFAGKTVAFIGAKGGVGASTVAHNTAWCISENAQADCVLVDMDLSFGTAGLDFNQDPAQTLGDALADPERLDEALLDRLLVRCTERLSLFSAPATLDKDWDFGPEAYETVLDQVKRQAPFITLDLPHTWSPWVKHTILSADQVVVTVTPELASLRNAKNLFDLVHASRPNDEPPKVVINMAGVAKRPEIPVKDFAEALGVQPALVLPFEPQLFGKAANDGQMIAEIDPKSKAAEGFAHLASMISGRTSVPVKKGLFGGLFGK